eukprot:GDKK01071203.1.p1 GENE.GDKK01071203.1~~GDKK01071203.1.p1  ORF type:complete len:479 (+),score=105.13 GDKK01071203.1:1-1437(+)
MGSNDMWLASCAPHRYTPPLNSCLLPDDVPVIDAGRSWPLVQPLSVVSHILSAKPIQSKLDDFALPNPGLSKPGMVADTKQMNKDDADEPERIVPNAKLATNVEEPSEAASNENKSRMIESNQTNVVQASTSESIKLDFKFWGEGRKDGSINFDSMPCLSPRLRSGGTQMPKPLPTHKNSMTEDSTPFNGSSSAEATTVAAARTKTSDAALIQLSPRVRCDSNTLVAQNIPIHQMQSNVRHVMQHTQDALYSSLPQGMQTVPNMMMTTLGVLESSLNVAALQNHSTMTNVPASTKHQMLYAPPSRMTTGASALPPSASSGVLSSGHTSNHNNTQITSTAAPLSRPPPLSARLSNASALVNFHPSNAPPSNASQLQKPLTNVAAPLLSARQTSFSLDQSAILTGEVPSRFSANPNSHHAHNHQQGNFPGPSSFGLGDKAPPLFYLPPPPACPQNPSNNAAVTRYRTDGGILAANSRVPY